MFYFVIVLFNDRASNRKLPVVVWGFFFFKARTGASGDTGRAILCFREEVQAMSCNMGLPGREYE